MLFLCCANLIIYFDQNFLFRFSDPLRSLSPLLSTWDQNVFYENYIFYVKPIMGTFGSIVQTGLIKNSGIFGEGGVYQYYLNLSLIINLYFLKRPFFSFSNWIFVFTILSTFSTLGYIIMIIVLAYTAIGKSYEPNIYWKMIIILPFLLFLSFSTVIVDKIFNQESQDYLVSTQRRMLDATIDLQIIRDKPLLGIGLGNEKEYAVYRKRFMGGRSSSNGILQHMTAIGIIGALITLYPFIFFRFKSKGKYMILLCNILTGLTQGIIMTPIFLLSMSILHENR